MAASTVMLDVVGKVTFVHKLPMIIKATSDDEVPTAGYLYQEIADLTYVSSSYCKSLLDVLVDRLDKPSHHVKFKVLRVMKYVVENGSEEFHSGLLRRSTGVQLATKFSGPPDPLHGNAPYVAVRTAAKELSEVLFDTEHSQSKERGQRREAVMGSFKASQCFGSMDGFGNTDAPLQKQKSLGNTIKEGFRQLTDSFLEPPWLSNQSNLQSDYMPLKGSESDTPSTSSSYSFLSGRQRTSLGMGNVDRRGQYKPVVMDDRETPQIKNCQPANPDVKRITAAHKKGKPAGGWADSSGEHGSNSSNSDGQHSGESTDLSERLESVAVEDVSMETKLVEDFVNARNTRATPSRDALAQFVKSCSTLNCEKVTELLGHELQSSSVAVQMKCLCALETLMREDIVSVEHLDKCLASILKKLQADTTQRLLQAKASKILRQLERAQKEISASRPTKPQQGFTESPETETIIEVPQSSDLKSKLEMTTLLQIGEMHSMPETVTTCHSDKSLPVQSPNTCQISQQNPTKVLESLFSGMEVGSSTSINLKLQDANEGLETNGSRNGQFTSANSGQSQLLDELLDLSTTGHPTLAPNSSVPTNRLQRSPQYHSETCEQTSELGLDTVTNCKLLMQGSGHQENSETATARADLDSSQPPANPRKPDPVMSHNATFQDLLASTGIFANTVTNNPSSLNTETPKQGQPPPTIRPQSRSMNADQISLFYPQLGGASLSGSSVIPMKLGRPQQDGSFAFISSDGTTSKASSFDFVKDAMMSNKK